MPYKQSASFKILNMRSIIKYYPSFLMFLFIVLFIPCQSNKAQSSLNSHVDTLVTLFNQMYKLEHDRDKLKQNDKIVAYFNDFLSIPNSFEIKLDTLSKIGKLTSEDGKVKIFTWNIPFIDGTHQYSGFIQYKPYKNSVPEIYKLTDKSIDMADISHAVLTPEKWFGMLYYKIVQVTYKKEDYYVLLGFDFNNPLINKKIIDVLYFQDGKIKFGYPFFMEGRKTLSRLTFNYSANVVMNLRYNEKLKMIIFDHLAPTRPSLEGDYEFYGPDGTFDGYKFENGMWIKHSDVNIKKDNAY